MKPKGNNLRDGVRDGVRFRHGHATHPDWRTATELCLAQVEGQAHLPAYARQCNLGFIYFTDALAPHARDIVALLQARTGIGDWTGTVGIGIVADAAEYMDEPAMAIMLAQFPIGSVQVFSGLLRPPARDARTPSGAYAAHTALIHADPRQADLTDLLEDMAGKVRSGHLIGGLSSARGQTVQVANDCLSGGLSGVVFASDVALTTRLSQGCHPLGPIRTVSRGKDNLIAELDGKPALDALLEDRHIRTPGGAEASAHREILVSAVRSTLCGLLPNSAADGAPAGWGDAEVRPLIGVDPQRGVLAIGDQIKTGARLQFCERDATAARRDLIRICTELRTLCEERDGGLDAVRGALYITCLGRGSSLFGDESVEAGIIREHLGDLPLIGFFANGEIARQQLYGYTGILTLFF